MTDTKTQSELDGFTCGLTAAAHESLLWWEGQIELDVDLYLTDRQPPPSLTSSSRCVILSGASVLVMSNANEEHLLPGGTIEPGETAIDTVVREIREETGLAIASTEQVAVMVFRHRTPKPDVYPYPYPVFLQSVFWAIIDHAGELRFGDPWEQGGQFLSIPEAAKRISRLQRTLLDHVVYRVVGCRQARCPTL